MIEESIRNACTDEKWEEAATIAIKGYGPELLGFLNALLRDAAAADDVFAVACEKLWRGLPQFGWQSSFRTWAYAVARNTCTSYLRSGKPPTVGVSKIDAIAMHVRTETRSYLKSETKDRLSEVRAALDPDDQTLLILRIDRKLPWRDVARVFEDDDASPEVIDRRAAALRKRLERLKTELRDKLTG
jgi:RNA polymerase sigma-70 factor (ECF subfamily)